MPQALRLSLAAISGLAGLAGIFLTLNPAAIQQSTPLVLICLAVLMSSTLVNTVMDALNSGGEETAGNDDSRASPADREVHAEVVKIIGLLKNQEEATTSFSKALDKATGQLPESMTPEKVKLVVSYLMAENENMRKRTSELQASLETSQRQIERLKSNLAAAEAQGLSDPLTTLKNRRSFDLTLAAEVSAARLSLKPLSLVMADIDHFKSINDRYGHQSGDDVLRWFARILSNNMKGRDTVARYGGEEFAIIMPQTSLENAVMLAGQIKAQLEQQFWKKPGAPNTMLRVTASFGVAQLSDGEGTSGLLARADAKLYESKSKGRNRVAA
jgi:diguanylate cyclase